MSYFLIYMIVTQEGVINHCTFFWFCALSSKSFEGKKIINLYIFGPKWLKAEKTMKYVLYFNVGSKAANYYWTRIVFPGRGSIYNDGRLKSHKI